MFLYEHSVASLKNIISAIAHKISQKYSNLKSKVDREVNKGMKSKNSLWRKANARNVINPVDKPNFRGQMKKYNVDVIFHILKSCNDEYYKSLSTH